jgi:hypothetical protein
VTLNIGEANAVNDVIGHLIGRRYGDREMVSREKAVDAIALLARAAHKTLHAGYDQIRAHQALTDRWPEPVPTFELEHLRAMAKSHEQCLATAAEREYRTGTCDGCTCCTNQQCAERKCPESSWGESVCPCTCD